MASTPGNHEAYQAAGVDLEAAGEATRRIKADVASTYTERVVSDFGTFGGMFAAGWPEMPDPILVSSIDGVGTKVKLAAAADRLAGTGEDIVNHCVNDILVQGARPLFFMDYYGTGKLSPDNLAQVVAGIAKACRLNGCALLAGETAEMPGVYPEGTYDLVGAIVGVVDRSRVLDGSRVGPGDVLVALASSGLHTNGYSLVRKVLFDNGRYNLNDGVPELEGTLADAVLAPHRSYLPVLARPLEDGRVNALAHITGGGLTDNLPRSLPEGCLARIDTSSWQVPALFQLIQREAQASREQMLRTFNMGVGMVAVMARDQCPDCLIKSANQHGIAAWQLGTIEQTTGTPCVEYS